MTDFEEFLKTPHGKIILDNLELTAKLINDPSIALSHKADFLGYFTKLIVNHNIPEHREIIDFLKELI